ncbi:unnamed protein product [Trichogramma brassicae]|uniref:Uncharacterized protein n=1 Tax=Trichogramma brassicae TaxID=86971 RepID=A0A6H5IUU9_9HYME|nr:unnamed protein product [Trichogramma brassicae]
MDKVKTDLGLLEEDDEFEEFPAEVSTETAAAASTHTTLHQLSARACRVTQISRISKNRDFLDNIVVAKSEFIPGVPIVPTEGGILVKKRRLPRVESHLLDPDLYQVHRAFTQRDNVIKKIWTSSGKVVTESKLRSEAPGHPVL